MNIILFDDNVLRENLLPFTYTRPVAEIRCGILKISEKWQKHTGATISFLTPDYLSAKYPANWSTSVFLVNGAVFPTPELVKTIQEMPENSALLLEQTALAIHYKGDKNSIDELFKKCSITTYTKQVQYLAQPWDIFVHNGNQIREDFALLTKGRTSAGVNDKNTIVYNEAQVFVEEGAKIRAAVINAEDGPVYIGKNAEIQEGALIKGPFAMCEGAVINMGGKMRGDSTIGPYSKVGGEVSNSVIFGYSNKAHDGFIGNTVIAEWCNLGADTNTSNLKNNYSNVKIWRMIDNTQIDTQRQFCGMLMGDHSKTGINTMLNTGTVVGVAANIFGGGFPDKNIPSYSWGGAEGFEEYELKKAFETMKMVYSRRKKEFDKTEQDILTHLFEHTKQQRKP